LANKELTARVKLDIGDAESKLKKLSGLFKNIDRVVNGKSSNNGLDASIDKQIMQQEKLQKLTAQRQLAEEKLAQAKLKTQQTEDAYVDKIINKELSTLQQKQQQQWKAFQAEQNAYDKQIAKAEQLKQKELEKERIRQQSLKTLGQGDIAAQKMTASIEKQARAEYKAWWQSQLIKQEWQKAHPILGQIQKGWDRVNSKIQQAIARSPRLSNAYNKVTTKLGQIRTKVSEWSNLHRKVEDGARRINAQYSKSGSLLGTITGKLRGLISTYLGVMGMGAIINTSDMITSAENKLNYVSAQNLGASGTNEDGSYSTATINATQDAMDKMYNSSKKVRMGYTDMMSNVSKSMSLAGDAFNNNTDAAIRFQEIMAEAYAVGGAEAQEMSSSMYQLIQALGAGVLAGDELRSVREGAPLAYKEIEKFAQKTLDSTDSLKDLASQGLITSDMVVSAIMQSGEAMDDAFAQTEQTFAQTWEQIKNAAVYAFKPISEMLRTELNNAIDNGLLDKVETLFAGIGKGIMIGFAVIKNAIGWIADNWNWLKYIVGAALIVIGALLLKTAAIAILSATFTALKWLWANKVLIIIAITIMALIYVWQQFKSGAISACEAIVYALLIVGAAILLIGILIGSVPMMIIGAVLILLGVIFMFFEQVCGGVAWLVMFIVNIVQAILGFIMGVIIVILSVVINCILGIINFGHALESAIGTICSNIGIFFTNTFNKASASFWTFIGDVLSGLSSLEPAFNAIAKLFGLEGVTLSGLTQGAYDKANATKDNIKEYESVGDAWNKGLNTYEYIDLGEAWSTGWNAFGTPFEEGWSSNAYNAGADWGAGIKDSIDEKLSKYQKDSNEKGSLLDNIGDKLGLNLDDMFTFPEDLPLDYGLPELDGIGDDVSSIKDSMDLKDDDLEYLRKIAEMEWRKEFTTAEIKVDMSNYNTINGDRDLDGIVDYLSDVLRSEMTSVAEGVHY
jgi:tape measure domain-containing protein